MTATLRESSSDWRALAQQDDFGALTRADAVGQQATSDLTCVVQNWALEGYTLANREGPLSIFTLNQQATLVAPSHQPMRDSERQGFVVNMTIFLWAGLLASTAAAAGVPSPEIQINAAVLAAPAELREGASVLGYSSQGELVRLREGKNELICLANDPSNTRFSVACYHRDLEPYMARGRELLAQKVTGQKRNDIRWKEVAEGKLIMPREARTLYVLTGTGFDATSGKVADPYLRWVIYIPFATPESTGLSTKPSDNAPWLMSPGTAGAHIMINPPKK